MIKRGWRRIYSMHVSTLKQKVTLLLRWKHIEQHIPSAWTAFDSEYKHKYWLRGNILAGSPNCVMEQSLIICHLGYHRILVVSRVITIKFTWPPIRLWIIINSYAPPTPRCKVIGSQCCIVLLLNSVWDDRDDCYPWKLCDPLENLQLPSPGPLPGHNR